jgi:hypothetical protein
MGLLHFENQYREIVFGARDNFREGDVISRLACKKESKTTSFLKDFLSWISGDLSVLFWNAQGHTADDAGQKE